MNWLTPLCHQVLALKQCSRDHRDTMILWVNELSALCDKYQRNAPAPNVEHFTEEQVREEGHPLTDARRACICVSWFNLKMQRSFSVFVNEFPHSVELHVLDERRAERKRNPSHDLVKAYLQAFFEGWSPNDAR